jgi:hypothetical protein
MSLATANQAISALYGVLKRDQTIEFIFRGGMDNGRQVFSFQIRGKAKAKALEDAELSLQGLKQNLGIALAARPGLCFGDVDAGLEMSNSSSHNWRAQLVPQGVLVSCGSEVQSVSQKGKPASVHISPVIPSISAKLTMVDAILASPQIVEVVVSVKRRTLSESDQQALNKILKAIDYGKASYLMLPERRKAVDAEREVIIEPLVQHLTRWLVTTWGIELKCVVYANEPSTDVFMSLLGRALFPYQKVTFSIASDVDQLSMAVEQYDSIDLRSFVHASGYAPAFFPELDQLANIDGIKRHYARPQHEPSEFGLCLGLAGGREVCLTQADRSRHIYIIGATGSGKSTLIYNMVMQDLAAGEGVCVMDPHGDLYDEVLESIPASRQRDVVLINPCDFDYAVGINFLEINGTHRQVEMGFIVNEMIKIFDRLYNMRIAGGPVFEQYMRNALMLVMDNDFPGTLMDVIRIFEDKAYLKNLVEICHNPLVSNFWMKQALRAGGDTDLKNIAPYITSKLNQFTHNPLMRSIIGQSKSSINFRQIVDNKSILLVNLSKGQLGEMDSKLLGMILIGKLFLAGMKRANIAKDQRIPFNWYIDEFQNFATDSIAHLLSESRKYGIRMILANQTLAQLHLSSGGEGLREAVLGNVANMLLFRVGVDDARHMQSYAQPELSSEDLQYLPDFHAVARLLKNNAPLRPFVLQTLPKQEYLFNGMSAFQVRNEIVALSRAKYARPAKEVDCEIFARAKMPGYLAHDEGEVKKLLSQINSEKTDNHPVDNDGNNTSISRDDVMKILEESLSE